MGTTGVILKRRGMPAMLAGFVVAAVVFLAAAPSLVAQQRPIIDIPSTPLPQRTWVDVNGEPLPYYNDDQIQEFLQTADVVDREELPVGVTNPQRVTLESGKIKTHGVFRFVNTTYDSVRMTDGRLRTNLKDNCHFETAAYELSRVLGLDVVPPVVTRRIGSDNGTLQIWVYNAVMEDERVEQGMSAPNRLAWMRQVDQMYAFDSLIGNDDRTQQNILIDENFKVWLIDHTRAFYRGAQMNTLAQVKFIERGFWEAMQALDRATVDEAVGAYLTDSEIDELMERRDRVVAHVQALIDERGEGAVVFEWAPTEPGRR